MTESPSPSQAPIQKKEVPRFKRGSLIRVKRIEYQNSLESLASDPSPPEYIFEGPGEILSIKGDYAQVRWRKPVPDVWLPTSNLEAWS